MFEINKKTSIMLYGYSSRGIPIYKQMKKAGYHVKGFFDRNAEKLRKMGPADIWTVQEYDTIDKEAVVVVICFENAIEQNKVAEYLFQNGFGKIVYLPMGTEYRQDIAMQMRKMYNFLLEENYEMLKEIPEYEEMKAECNVWSIIKKENGYYTVWIPIEYVYTDNVIRIPYAEKKRNDKEFIAFVHQYLDIPLYTIHTYLSLYQYFLGQSELDEDYFRFQDLKDNREDFESYRAGLLKDRYQLYRIYDQEFNRGTSFFIDSAPKAVWNEKGYFNLTDGHHRSAFLYTMGYTSIPLTMAEDDYILYKEYVENEELKVIFMNENRDYLVKIMPKIFESILEYDLGGYWLQDFGQNNGYFTAVAKKMGIVNKKNSIIDEHTKGIIFLMENQADAEQLEWLRRLHGGFAIVGMKEEGEKKLIEQKTGWSAIKEIGSFFNGEDLVMVRLYRK